MDLKPNFPSAIPEEEMSEVLTEFFQRGQSQAKTLAPPPPFEVTTSVVQAQPPEIAPRRRHDVPDVAQPSALAIEEKYYEFVPIQWYGYNGLPFRLGLQWFFRCKTEGSVAHNSYIRTYPGGFWQSVTPPGYSGTLGYVFNQSQWFPPAYNEQGAYVELVLYLGNVPVSPLITEAHAYFAMYIEEVGNPNNISDRIYASHSILDWNWYNAQHGIGFNLTFHTHA